MDQLESRCLLSQTATTVLHTDTTADTAKVVSQPVELLKIHDGHIKISTKVDSVAKPHVIPTKVDSAVKSHVQRSTGLGKDLNAGPAKVTVHPASVRKVKGGTKKASVKNRSMVASPAIAGYTPDEIRTAYGLPSLTGLSSSWSGAGETIAVVVAYNTADLASNLATFDAEFGLPAATLQVVNQSGAASPLPSSAPLASGQTISSWEKETSLDVEMIHEIAPGANIDVVEANSTSLGDLDAAVATAAALPGVSVVSMSWDAFEAPNETSLDSTFTTPAGHQGVTFVAASGDSGSFATYPASSPNVLAVGGTTLELNQGTKKNPTVSYGSESSWSLGGAGASLYEAVPSYQASVIPGATNRMTPDVSFDANPSTGVAMYDGGGWTEAGGTSVGAPAWAAIVAIADGMRAGAGYSSLDGASETLPAIYSLPSSDFHKVGSSNYNSSTGLGSPVANTLIPDLASYGTGISFQASAQQSTSQQSVVKKAHAVVKVVAHHVVKFVTHSKVGSHKN